MDPEKGALRDVSSSPEASVGTSSNATVESDAPRQRIPRSLPPWIGSYESDDGPVTKDKMQLLYPPGRSVLPQHNHQPTELERRISKDGFIDWASDPLLEHRGTPPKRLTLHQVFQGARGQQGRKWDHLRTAEPVVVAAYGARDQGPAAVWRHYLQSSIYGAREGERSEVADPEILDKLQPNFNQPFDTPLYPQDAKAQMQAPGRRRTLAQRVWRSILRNPFVPLLFRLVVLVTSIVSLAVAARIYIHEGRLNNGSAERTQAVVAIVIDVVAVPYIGYTLWDEYTGKPLGLRAATHKIAFILLDLFFIIFKSASTALAFESLMYHNQGEAVVAALSSALAAFMFVGILAWTMNFMVNIFRTVARLGPSDEAGHRRT